MGGGTVRGTVNPVPEDQSKRLFENRMRDRKPPQILGAHPPPQRLRKGIDLDVGAGAADLQTPVEAITGEMADVTLSDSGDMDTDSD